MLHSRIFSEDPGYREEHFTTCEGDRCANPSAPDPVVTIMPSCK